MKFSIKTTSRQKLQSDCLIIGIFEGKKLSAPKGFFNKQTLEALEKILASGDMDGKENQSLLLHLPDCAERLILVGLGKEKSFGKKEYAVALQAAFKCLKGTQAKHATLLLETMHSKKLSVLWQIRHTTIIASEVFYSFDTFKSKKTESVLEEVSLLVSEDVSQNEAQTAISQGQAIAEGMALAKDLGNTPGNVCTPDFLAKAAQQLAEELPLQCEVLERADMEKLGMHSLLSVTKGSHQPPKFVILKYNGKSSKGKKPYVLVGKGITFDTGGISLKPGADMDQMKYDMSGAASVLGTMKAVAMMRLPIELIALMPCVENMPGGNASRPGDIVSAMSGLTIEILNTDAEGRLILADALTYAERFNPECVIDTATLTGACVIALGKVASGLFANDEALSKDLVEAGQASLDRAWPMPLWEDYHEQIKSPFADLANIGGRDAGSVTAACFLSRFAEKFSWAHLDIAGTAWNSGASKGSTGRPVPLLAHYLMKKAGKDL